MAWLPDLGYSGIASRFATYKQLSIKSWRPIVFVSDKLSQSACRPLADLSSDLSVVSHCTMISGPESLHNPVNKQPTKAPIRRKTLHTNTMNFMPSCVRPLSCRQTRQETSLFSISFNAISSMSLQMPFDLPKIRDVNTLIIYCHACRHSLATT